MNKKIVSGVLLVLLFITVIFINNREEETTPLSVISDTPIVDYALVLNKSLAEVNEVLSIPYNSLETVTTVGTDMDDQWIVIDRAIYSRGSFSVPPYTEGKQFIHPEVTISLNHYVEIDKTSNLKLEFTNSRNEVTKEEALQLIGINPNDFPLDTWRTGEVIDEISIAKGAPPIERIIIRYRESTTFVKYVVVVSSAVYSENTELLDSYHDYPLRRG